MKIALVILHADPARGGAERYTFDLAQSLAGRGHAVSLIASSFGPRPAGVESVELPAGGVTRLGRYNRFLRVLEGRLEKERFDVIHAMLPVGRCDLYHPHAGIAAEAIQAGHEKHASPLRRRLAGWANRINMKRRRFARIERQLLGSDAPPIVLSLSNYIQSAVLRHYPLPADRLATLFNAVDLERFDPSAHVEAGGRIRQQHGLDGRIVALMVAQDFQRKGLAEAIRALAGCGQPSLSLLVVGRPDSAPYAALARSLNLQDRVVFAGPAAQTAPYYACADCFILPTRHDPCSLVVLEALAMGLPVLSTRQNGACEIMTPGVHGWVLDSADDEPAWIDALRRIADPQVRSAMRQACLDLRPRLSGQRHIDALESIYRRVAPG